MILGIQQDSHPVLKPFFEVHEIEADEACAEKLKVQIGDPLVMVKKKYMIDGKVVVFDMDIFPKKLVLKEYVMADFTKSIYHFFREKCGTNVEIMVSRISAQEYEGELYLHIDEVGNNIMQTPVLWSRQYYKSQQFQYFTIVRRRAL